MTLKALRGKRNTSPEPASGTVRLTHPERVVYPDVGVTKRAVADYYIAMMDWVLPEIVGRPISLVRCPGGIEQTCFFQRHLSKGLKWVDTVPLVESGGGEDEYLVVRDARGLLELVQFNVLEFHPWGARADAPDRADRVVFDLDPGPDVAWREVAAAARRARELLAAASIESFVRTSGGKGLHVVVPLNPACDWSLVKPFAQGLAQSMAQAEPDRYVATASKKLRGGRIFVDYLRNDRSASSVASFSLRARAGAPAAMPLRWEELGRVRSGAAFTLANAPARMRRLGAHPWGDYARLRQGLGRLSQPPLRKPPSRGSRGRRKSP
jgi:bifunctional non-homologous end joining protein LigD